MVSSLLATLALTPAAAAPITHDCGALAPVSGTFASCRAYFESTLDATDQVCVPLDSGADTLCEQHHVLLFPIDNGIQAVRPLDQLAVELDDLISTTFEAASYGRLLVHVDIVGEDAGVSQVVYRDGAPLAGRTGGWIDAGLGAPAFEEDPALHASVLGDPEVDFDRYDTLVNLASDRRPLGSEASSTTLVGYTLDDGTNSWTGDIGAMVVRQYEPLNPTSRHTEIRHHLGRLLGFEEAGFLRTDTRGVAPRGGEGSMMAFAPHEGQFTGLALWDAGWLPESLTVDVSPLLVSQDIVLQGLAIDDDTGLKMLRIPDGSDFYGITTRRGASGTIDADLDPVLTQGAMIRREAAGRQTHAIDATPETATTSYADGVLWPNRSLQVGDYHLTASHGPADDEVTVHVEQAGQVNTAPSLVQFASPPIGPNLACGAGMKSIRPIWDDPDGDTVYNHWRIDVLEGDTYGVSSFSTAEFLCVDAVAETRRIWVQGTDRKGGVTWEAYDTNTIPNGTMTVRRTGLERASAETACQGEARCMRFDVVVEADDPNGDPISVLDWASGEQGFVDEVAYGRANELWFKGKASLDWLSALVTDGGGSINADATLIPERRFEDQGAGACGARVGAAMAFHAGLGQTVLYGGEGTVNNSTCIYDGTGWTELILPGSPPVRHGARMAYDATRDVVVMYGGIHPVTGAIRGDTWTFDGNSWTEVVGAGPPVARRHGAMTAVDLDGTYGVALFGGRKPGGNTNQVWLFDGTGWVRAGVLGDVPPRMWGASAVFDPGHEEVYLYGGTNGAVVSNTTYRCAFDGSTGAFTCEELPWSGPPARVLASLTWDPVARRAVLLGGVSTPGGAGLTDVWEFDGEAWVDLTSTTDPIEPLTIGVVHAVEGSEVLVCYGGEDAGGILDSVRVQDVYTYTL